MTVDRLRPASVLLLLPLVLIQQAGAVSLSGSSTTNVSIPDNGGWVYSRVDISGAPADATVTSVEVYFRCMHPYSEDLIVDLEVGSYTNSYRLWHNEGGAEDNPSRTVATEAFNGLPVNNSWYLYALDTEALDAGYIDEWSITISYQIPNERPDPFSKVAPLDSTGIADYTVTFQWAPSSDPDGDAVTYNLVVKDSSENSVTSCTSDGISTLNRSCNLPEQPYEDYYWQVWAVDSYGNDREASGPFWHIWTDPKAENQPPGSFAKIAPWNGAGVSSYSVAFDWDDSTDPEGDAVTYTLIVNDAFGGSVAACTEEGLSTSNWTCNLPEVSNQDYFWQVWAMDSYGRDREASGNVWWHVWTDTERLGIFTDGFEPCS